MINQKYHFDITPHIVKQLGEQLVSDEITALLELIKNSFEFPFVSCLTRFPPLV